MTFFVWHHEDQEATVHSRWADVLHTYREEDRTLLFVYDDACKDQEYFGVLVHDSYDKSNERDWAWRHCAPDDFPKEFRTWLLLHGIT